MAEPTDERWHVLSEEIFRGMRAWRAAHPRATFRAIEAEVDARLARLRAQLVADSAQASPARDWRDQEPAAQPHCPACNQPLTPRGRHPRHLRSHHNQPLTLEREYGTCPQCGQGFFPPG